MQRKDIHQLFFFLLLTLLPTQLGYHLWPDWAFVLGRRVDYLSPTLFLTDVILLLMLVSWSVVSRPKVHLSRKGVVLFLAGALFIFANIAVSNARPVAVYYWFKVLEFALLGWYIVKTKPALSRVTFCLSIGVLYSSLISLGQFYFQRSLGGPVWLLGERTFTVTTPGIARLSWCMSQPSGCKELLRAYGTFPHPNVLGGFLATTSVFMVGLLLDQAKKLGRFALWYWVALLLGIAGLAVTFSRSAWVAAVIGIAGISILYYVTQRKRTPVMYATIMVVLFVVFTVALRPSVTEESVVVRADLIKSALTLWQQSPLFGIGLGNFLVDLPFALPQRQIYFLQPVHNVYLLLLTETGVIGFVGFILLLVKSMKLILVRMMDTKNRHLVFRTMIIATPYAILLLLGLIDHYPLTLQQGQLLFVIFLSLSFS